MLDLTSILSGTLGAAIVAGVFMVLQIIFNKKLRTPADETARDVNAAAERFDILDRYKTDASEARTEAKEAKKEAKEANDLAKATDDRLDKLQDEFREFREEWVNWGYRAVATIRRLGTDEDVPRPAPNGLHI